jgi:hypothetical protein
VCALIYKLIGTSPQVFDMMEYIVDQQGYLVEVPVFRPVIYTTVYGSDVYYECLRLFLLSLVTHGNYRGSIRIFSDRSPGQVRQYVPEVAKDSVSHVSMDKGDWIQRYNVCALGLQEYSPILYVDNDIIIDRDISPILTAISSRRQVCVITEADTYPELSVDSISQISDQRRIGNWWGLEILRADSSCSEDLLPLANSGVMGFGDHSVFALVGRLVTELFRSSSHALIAEWFGDQPFLNYVLVKTKLGEYEVLRKTCNFLGSSGSFPEERRGFAHFNWARHEEKAQQMGRYLSHLNGALAPRN